MRNTEFTIGGVVYDKYDDRALPENLAIGEIVEIRYDRPVRIKKGSIVLEYVHEVTRKSTWDAYISYIEELRKKRKQDSLADENE